LELVGDLFDGRWKEIGLSNGGLTCTQQYEYYPAMHRPHTPDNAAYHQPHADDISCSGRERIAGLVFFILSTTIFSLQVLSCPDDEDSRLYSDRSATFGLDLLPVLNHPDIFLPQRCLACRVCLGDRTRTHSILTSIPASVDLDECIDRLYRKELLADSVIEAICAKAKELLMKESNVVHIQAPVTVVGDIHGQFFDMIEIFKIGGYCPDTNYLFLGRSIHTPVTRPPHTHHTLLLRRLRRPWPFLN
jgi:hypothetical protein